MILKLIVSVLLSVTLLSGEAAMAAASCEGLMPSTSRPDWVNRPPHDEYSYYGVGAAEKESHSWIAQKRLAKKEALRELSNVIKSTVSNRIEITQHSSKQGEKAQTTTDIVSVGEVVSNQTLRNIKYADTWLDQERCIVYVLAQVARKGLDASVDVELVNSLTHSAESGGIELNERMGAYEDALLLLNRINFSEYDGAESKDVMQGRLQRLGAKLESFLDILDVFRSAEDNVEQQLGKMRSTASANQRNKLYNKVVSTIESVREQYPYNEDHSIVAEPGAFRLAGIALLNDDDCLAYSHFANVAKGSYFTLWQDRAKAKLKNLNCSGEALVSMNWSSEFKGKTVSVYCVAKTDGQLKEWEKMCNVIEQKLRRYGADIQKGMKVSHKELQKMIKRQDFTSLVKHNSHALIFNVNGLINTRTSKKSLDGNQYQFQGAIANFYVSDEDIEFQDSFSGVGGWNPVSSAMALEVLALNVAKRWEKKFYKEQINP